MSTKSVDLKIDLLPKDPFLTSSFGRSVTWSLTIGKYIVIFTELIVILSFIGRFILDRRVMDLNEAISSKRKIITSFSELESDFYILKKKISNFKEIDGQYNIVSVYPLIADVLPPEIALEKLAIGKESIAMDGLATSNNDLYILIDNFQRSNIFYNVNVKSIESESKKEVGMKFSLTAAIRNQKE